MIDEQQLAAALRAPAPEEGVAPGAEDRILAGVWPRATRIRRRRRLAVAGPVLSLLIAVAVLAVSLGHSMNGSAPLPVATLPTMPAPSTAVPSIAEVAAAQPVLAIVDGTSLALYDGVHAKPVRKMTGSGYAAVAARPGGGWIAAISSAITQCGPSTPPPTTRLVTVTGSGVGAQFGPTLSGTATSAAVSPDGTQVAVTLVYGCGAPAQLAVVGLDGATSSPRLWTYPVSQGNWLVGVSWAPDSHNLAFTPGSQTGAGVSGPYGTADTDAITGMALPDTPHGAAMLADGCELERVLWLGRTGREAVLGECPKTQDSELIEVTPGTVDATSRPVIRFPVWGGAGMELTSSSDGRTVLLSEGDTTWISRDGVVTKVPGSASWTAAAPEDVLSPSAATSPSAPVSTAAPKSVVANLSEETTDNIGTIYGVEPIGDGPPFSGYRLVSINATTLAIRRSAEIVGRPGGIAITFDGDNDPILNVVTGTALFRFSASTFARLPTWTSPYGSFTGPLVSTRFGLWVADSTGLIKFLSDGSVGATNQHLGGTVCGLAATSIDYDAVGTFTALVSQPGGGCEWIGTVNALGGFGSHGISTPGAFTQAPVPELGWGELASDGRGGFWTTAAEGMSGIVWHFTPSSGEPIHWTGAPTPWRGTNGISVYAAAGIIWASDANGLSCETRAGTLLHVLGNISDGDYPIAFAVGKRPLAIYTTGRIGSPTGPRVVPLTADPRCDTTTGTYP